MKKLFQRKQHNKSKEQIAAEMKQAADTKRLREFSKKHFYPFLLERNKSIKEAKIFCQMLSTAKSMAFNRHMEKMTIGELGLEDHIRTGEDPTGVIQKTRDALAMFREMSVKDFNRVVEDMAQAIEGLLDEWQGKGTLQDLKSPFPEENIQ